VLLFSRWFHGSAAPDASESGSTDRCIRATEYCGRRLPVQQFWATKAGSGARRPVAIDRPSEAARESATRSSRLSCARRGNAAADAALRSRSVLALGDEVPSLRMAPPDKTRRSGYQLASPGFGPYLRPSRMRADGGQLAALMAAALLPRDGTLMAKPGGRELAQPPACLSLRMQPSCKYEAAMLARFGETTWPHSRPKVAPDVCPIPRGMGGFARSGRPVLDGLPRFARRA
jgi:hypothetical protein